MSGRIIAIGDIHGCLAALQAVLAALDPHGDDTIVTMGDYADRGPDVRGVLELLIALGKQTRLVPLLGNHDEMMLSVCRGNTFLPAYWLAFGGDATLASYGTDHPGRRLADASRVPRPLPFGIRDRAALLRACQLSSRHAVGPVAA